jgi:hypothetical protein
MTRLKIALLIGLMSTALSCGSANANPEPLLRNADETRLFVGLHWNFGDSRPELILGVRRTETTSDDQVFGGKVDIAIPLTNDLAAVKPVVRAMSVIGNREVQGEFGGGIRTMDWAPLLAAGMQGPYSNAGANYIFGDGLKPYIGVDTLARPRASRSPTPG